MGRYGQPASVCMHLEIFGALAVLLWIFRFELFEELAFCPAMTLLLGIGGPRKSADRIRVSWPPSCQLHHQAQLHLLTIHPHGRHRGSMWPVSNGCGPYGPCGPRHRGDGRPFLLQTSLDLFVALWSCLVCNHHPEGKILEPNINQLLFSHSLSL